MIKLIMSAALALGLTTPALARTGDKEHVFVSIIVSNFIYKSGATKEQAIKLCLAGGAFKEGLDAFGFGAVELIDMASNTIGCSLGVSKVKIYNPINRKYCCIGFYENEFYGLLPECKAHKAEKKCTLNELKGLPE